MERKFGRLGGKIDDMALEKAEEITVGWAAQVAKQKCRAATIEINPQPVKSI
jgi:hypothetical protein